MGKQGLRVWILVVLLAAIFGWAAVSSWAQWSAPKVRKGVAEAVPIEVQLYRLGIEVEPSESDIRILLRAIGQSPFFAEKTADQIRKRLGVQRAILERQQIIDGQGIVPAEVNPGKDLDGADRFLGAAE